MSIKWKLVIITLFFLILSISATSLIMVINTGKKSRQELELYRKEEYEKVANSLKNYVDIAYETIDSGYNNINSKEYIERQYGERLQGIIDIVESVIRRKMALVRARKLTLAQAKREAAAEIKNMRYEGSEYIWINDTGRPYPRMVMHPISPSLDGKVMSDKKYNVAMGKGQNLFLAFLEVCTRDGEGFVDYSWPKPTAKGLTEMQPKLSYVRLLKEWNWIIGTGIYMDDAVRVMQEETLRRIGEMRFDGGAGYFWVNDSGSPYPRMIMHPISPALNGVILSDEKYNVAMGKEQNLFQAMVEVTAGPEGAGFVDYLWAKTDSEGKATEQRFPKNSYVRRFEPWGWIVGTGVYTDEIEAAITKREEEARRQLYINMLLIVAISIVIILLNVAAIIFFVSFILAPLGSMQKVVNEVAGGKLTGKIEVLSKDEIGVISNHFNELVDNFRQLLLKIKGSVAVLSQSTGDLSVTSREISTTSNQQAAAVKEIVATMEDSTKLSRGIQTKIEEVSRIATGTKDNVASGFSIIEENKVKMKEITMTNSDTIVGIKSLGEQIDSIWDIVNIINSIADQTKIIAFNAELEASAAGEAGKNFEIVASEIRRLADNTVSSTREIKAKINEIQQASDNLIVSSEEGTDKIKEGLRLSIELEKLFSQILEHSELSASSAGQINLSINQEVAAFEQIFLTLKQISEGINNFVESTGFTTKTSVSISRMAEELNEVVKRYEVGDEDG